MSDMRPRHRVIVGTNLVLGDVEHQLDIGEPCREGEATLDEFEECDAC